VLQSDTIAHKQWRDRSFPFEEVAGYRVSSRRPVRVASNKQKAQALRETNKRKRCGKEIKVLASREKKKAQAEPTVPAYQFLDADCQIEST